MKEYFCDELNNALTFFHDKIMSCCTGQIGPVYIENYKGEKINWDEFRNVKFNAFKLLNSEDIEKTGCKNCFFLREKTENDKINPRFKTLSINHWTNCNCGCIYCSRMDSSLGKIDKRVQKSQFYDLLPVLKELYNQDLIDREHLTVSIQGGEISVLKEFPDLVKEFIKHGAGNFQIFSNNIIYQPIVKKLLEEDKVYYTTSLDCGSEEVYYKIKRVKKFKDSINNLKKYVKGIEYPKIIVKYIVLENINDNKEEILKFINLMELIKIRRVEFAIDYKYVLFTDLDKIPLPKHYGELYLNMKELCEKKGIQLDIWAKTENILNKYIFNKV